MPDWRETAPESWRDGVFDQHAESGEERGRDQEIAEIGFWGLLQRPCHVQCRRAESVTEALGTEGVRDDGMGLGNWDGGS